ncbi:MAG: hypothetical protein WC220_08410 [Pedobacter sp.]|jgi:hypothetical protein
MKLLLFKCLFLLIFSFNYGYINKTAPGGKPGCVVSDYPQSLYNRKIQRNLKGQNDLINSDYLERDRISHSVIVGTGGGADYTTIAAAFASIKNSSYDNQYEVLVRPGKYRENDLQLPAYTHLKGLGGPNAVLVYSDSIGALRLIDQKYPSKMSNLTLDVINIRSYVIHFDAPTLANGVTVNKNLKIIHKGGEKGSAVIGGGSWEGYISVWENCEFTGLSGLPACHTKQNSANAIDLRFSNCSFSSGVTLGSVGSYELSNATFRNCTFYGLSTGWISLIKNQPELWKYPANNFEWKISGGGNKGFVFNLSKLANAGEALKIEAVNFLQDLSISGTAVDILFGDNYKIVPANLRIKGKVIGWSDVRDTQSGLKPYTLPIDVIQMWKRLGDCSEIHKTLTVTVNGIAQTYVFDKNYLILKPSESLLIASINSVLRNAVVSKVPGIDVFDCLDMPERVTSMVGDADGILKNELVYFDGYTVKKAAQGSDSKTIKAIAVSEGKKGELITVWSGTFYTDLKDGEYGVGANTQLSIKESVKVGYVKNNVFFPYY